MVFSIHWSRLNMMLFQVDIFFWFPGLVRIDGESFEIVYGKFAISLM